MGRTDRQGVTASRCRCSTHTGIPCDRGEYSGRRSRQRPRQRTEQAQRVNVAEREGATYLVHQLCLAFRGVEQG